MVEQRGIIRGALALLLIAGALVCVSGCARAPQSSFPEGAARAAEQTGPVATSIAPAAQSGATPASGSVDASASGLSAQDASALDAELSAIQSELDRLSVPSDSDFDDIGAGLK